MSVALGALLNPKQFLRGQVGRSNPLIPPLDPLVGYNHMTRDIAGVSTMQKDWGKRETMMSIVLQIDRF